MKAKALCTERWPHAHNLTLFVLASTPVTMRYCTQQLHPAWSIFYLLESCTPPTTITMAMVSLGTAVLVNLIPFCVFVFLQRGGGIHGATLQAPALWRQEAGVWRQEEHLHSASTSYWEWEGTLYTGLALHHAIPAHSGINNVDLKPFSS